MGIEMLAPRALLARTATGSAELLKPASSLSVPQRKLLLLIHPGTDYESLMATGSADDRQRRSRDLRRLLELGLVSEVDANGEAVVRPMTAFAPASARTGPATIMELPPRARPSAPAPAAAPDSVATAPAAVASTVAASAAAPAAVAAAALAVPREPSPAPRKPAPLILLGVGGLVVAAIVAWALLGGGDSAPRAPASPSPATTTGAAPSASTVTPTPAEPSSTVTAGSASSTSTSAVAPATGGAPSAAASVAPASTGSATTPLVAPSASGRPADSKSAPRADAIGDRKGAGVANPLANPAGGAAATGARSTLPPSASPPPATSAPAPAATASATSAPVPAAASPPVVGLSTQPPTESASRAAQPQSAAQPPAAATTGPAASAASQAPLPASPPAAASSAPAPAATGAPKIVSRVDPAFPREAAQAGVSIGTVRARMRVAADGSVTAVEIVQSNPSRVFDRAVTRALSQWKFEPTGQPRTVDHEVEFR